MARVHRVGQSLSWLAFAVLAVSWAAGGGSAHAAHPAAAGETLPTLATRNPDPSQGEGLVLSGAARLASSLGDLGTVADHLALPDLQTVQPSGLRVSYMVNGRRVLRFHNTAWNAGRGPLELIGIVNPAAGQIEVRQHLTISGETGVDLLVGHFLWHPTHHHWHLDAFALYQLWSLTPQGELESLLNTSEKLSYCMIDTDIIDAELPGNPSSRGYRGCGNLRQGLSVGWGDEYRSHLEGQSVNIAGLADGVYALVSIANPAGTLYEADYSNNGAIVYFRLLRDRVFVLPGYDLNSAGCLADGKC